jgi:malonate-semialdehyde dehydrogenase (acetylating)/methylmalonate-semialdehyde dehydrogenase
VMVPLWMCTTAIACGNAFILKPSEKDPSAALFLAGLWQRAGLPDGVFTVLNGDREAVDAILAHPDIAAVSFVGSTPVARHIYETGTRSGKRVQALGGAKNHMVVLPDADVDMAADAAVSAAYGSAGERCMAISVVVTVGDVADPLVDAIAARLPKLRIGAGTDPDADMGPLITREHRDRVASYIDAGAKAGAAVVADGRKAELPAQGFFLGVSLLDHVRPEMSVYTDEIFGPVLCVVRAAAYAEALELVNTNPYGNGTAIFTRDGGVPVRRAGRHGRRERADPGTRRLLLLRRLEGLALRRYPHVRARRRALLYPYQGRHVALAGPCHIDGRPRIPTDPLTRRPIAHGSWWVVVVMATTANQDREG